LSYSEFIVYDAQVKQSVAEASLPAIVVAVGWVASATIGWVVSNLVGARPVVWPLSCRVILRRLIASEGVIRSYMARYEYAADLEGIERFIERPDGTRLRTVSSGTGDRTVVLAHGYGATADEWNVVAPLLVERGIRVVAFDQRGHGDSSIGSNGIGSAQMASDYGAIMEAYDVVDGVLVGHSMGGFLALAFLLDDQSSSPQRVQSLFLMATFAGDVNRKNPQNRLQIPLIQSGILIRLLGIGAIARAFTKSLIGDGFESEMSDAFITQFLASDHSKLVPILRALVDEDRYDRLDELDLPCTIMVGTEDKTTPPFHTADLHAGIAESKFVSIEGKGHLLNWEAPEDVAREIGLLAVG